MLTPVAEWIQTRLRTIPARVILRHTEDELGEECKSNDKISPKRDFVKRLLQFADLGISGMTVDAKMLDEETISKLDFLDKYKDTVREELIDSLRKEPLISINMLHKSFASEQMVPIPLHDESDGTRRLFELAIPWLETLEKGFTVVIDELECSLHPLLTRELIKLIHEYETDATGGQLIFATHDTTLLDPELFRRDQIWMIEKNREGASELYSLMDYKGGVPRNNEALQRGYLSGRYGAIPILEAFGMQ